ncbi:hypothetical protein UA08_04384 [Talaromyces atroroseus]|uniref:DDHD domain-containing protein n=1 Tax=Talaromyces atroroseus TaxID=1441469 RepID=A0A1Q5Q9G6_TALAT|nr:hypothetical protein UA08_04384 [Talaromyces atroroseus]OKL60751.1 hypothetical protein UA08_04384 [Talaromyces atroroseus]
MPGSDAKPSFLESISPWSTSRSTPPQPEPLPRTESLKQTSGQDHVTSSKKRLSSLRYPSDCPPLQTRWFYAVDTPKSKPDFSGLEKTEPKPLPQAKKFVPFSSKDTQAIEKAFQQLLRQESKDDTESVNDNAAQNTIKVPVNEDYLYDVDVDKRELGPAYWLGPIYEVRRGTWFFQEGSILKPCEENLATQLEEGYLKLKPWQSQYEQNKPKTGTTLPDSKSQVVRPPENLNSAHGAIEKKVVDEGRLTRGRSDSQGRSSTPVQTLPVHRLFGAYMNSTITYQDSTVAWLNHADFMSRVSSSVYQRLGGVGGTKVVRGYVEQGAQKEPVDGKGTSAKGSSAPTSRVGEREDIRLSQDKSARMTDSHDHGLETVKAQPLSTGHRTTLQRHMSSLNGETEDTAELEEEARKLEEQEMEDSREADDEDRDREIDHLVLVTHGIGQRLGLRLESINFIHDVNVLRKTMKSVYAVSPDLQALNSSSPDSKKNCRVQVLPVCWRHLLDFPRQGLRQNRRELDLADPDSLSSEDEQYPSLADITLEGVPAVRNLISDLAMDVLLYQSAYREHIMRIVQQECNRIFQLFKKRNPSFNGSVSMCGHSLGSAIMFDILCRQKNPPQMNLGDKGKRNDSIQTSTRDADGDYPLDFDCKEFFCLGSPIALFQMLKAKTIVGRSFEKSSLEQNLSLLHSHGPVSPSIDDPLEQKAFEWNSSISSPQCEELYNIFHPSDPVSYRLEPLISPAMTALKPQPLPFVKKSIWTASGQSLSNIGSRVGSMWTNFTSGVASSLLNRSLGIQPEEPSAPSHSRNASQHSMSEIKVDKESIKNNKFPANMKLHDNEVEFPTLIDSGLETLYEGFEKTRRSDAKSASESEIEAEDRSRRLRIEEAKVRALNSNGRVDYGIQECYRGCEEDAKNDDHESNCATNNTCYDTS